MATRAVRVQSQARVVEQRDGPATTATAEEAAVRADVDARFKAVARRARCSANVQDCVCPSDDICSECCATSRAGRPGHIFWDEVEMRRHGWSDVQCRHFSSSEPKDEVALLHEGKVDAFGHPDQHAAVPLRSEPVVAPLSIRFDPTPTTTDVPDDAAAERDCETSVSMADVVARPPAARRTLELSGGGQLSVARCGDRHAYRLVTPNTLVFFEPQSDHGRGMLISLTRPHARAAWTVRRIGKL